MLEALATHRAHGTTRSLISHVANPLAPLRESLSIVAELTAIDPLVLGSHLEGPFLAAERRGAHDAAFLREPGPEMVEELLGAARGTLRPFTIAPELPNALEIDRRAHRSRRGRRRSATPPPTTSRRRARSMSGRGC